MSALPAGEDVDDDFAPLDVDNTGFDPAMAAIVVNLGDLSGGSVVTISFLTTVR